MIHVHLVGTSHAERRVGDSNSTATTSEQVVCYSRFLARVLGSVRSGTRIATWLAWRHGEIAAVLPRRRVCTTLDGTRDRTIVGQG
jgi:hypothetical protein